MEPQTFVDQCHFRSSPEESSKLGSMAADILCLTDNVGALPPLEAGPLHRLRKRFKAAPEVVYSWRSIQ